MDETKVSKELVKYGKEEAERILKKDILNYHAKLNQCRKDLRCIPGMKARKNAVRTLLQREAEVAADLINILND